MTNEVPKRLQGALLRIRGDHPFFGTLALFAEIRVDDTVATAATDGKVIWFNPGFVDKQDSPQLCGLVAHELLHAALLHGQRRRERDPRIWNIAADIVVNGMIRSDTAYGLPEGGVEDPTLAHLSVEEIYEQLRGGKRKLPSITLLDLVGGVAGQTAMEEAQAGELQSHWRAALQQAAAVARRMGRVLLVNEARVEPDHLAVRGRGGHCVIYTNLGKQRQRAKERMIATNAQQRTLQTFRNLVGHARDLFGED